MSTLHRRVATAGVTVGLIMTPAVTAAPASARDHDRPGHGHHAHGDRWLARDITDAEFLTKAAQSNRFEILTGELAQERASAAVVKELGAMLVRDHTAALAQGSRRPVLPSAKCEGEPPGSPRRGARP